jgi:hypothetical protein
VSETFQQILPSGKTVELRHLDLVDLLLDGHIPDPLTSLVEIKIAQTLQARGTATYEELEAVKSLLEPNPEHEDRAVAFVRFIVRQGTVNPIICDDLKEARRLRAEGQHVDHIAHYTREDLYAIFFAAQGVAAELLPFLYQHLFQEPAVAGLPDMPGDEPERGGAAEHSAEPAVGEVHGKPGGDAVGAVRGGQSVRAQRQRGRTVDHPATAGRPK